MKSPKEITVEQWLMRMTQELIDITPEEDNLPLHVIHDLINNKEIQAVQDYANPCECSNCCTLPESLPHSRQSR